MTVDPQQIDRDGFTIVPEVLGPAAVARLRAAVEMLGERDDVLRRGGTYGVRNLLDVVPEASAAAAWPELRRLVEPVLSERCFAVRGTLFDKIPGANWSLFWHQDSIITVRERRDVPGFGKFALKAGVWHCEPPFAVFERMLTLRVHLDDCGPDNGPLRVLPGSHRSGWVEHDLQEGKGRGPDVVCTVPAGGAVVMRPLILHASSAAVAPSHRRVLHIEYAVDDLPGGLEWHTRIGPQPCDTPAAGR